MRGRSELSAAFCVALLGSGCGSRAVGLPGSPDGATAAPTPAAEAGASVTPDRGGAISLDTAPAPTPAPASWTLHGSIVVEKTCASSAGETVYVALSEECGDWKRLLSLQTLTLKKGSTAKYSFQVPDGVYFLIALLDCDGSASADAPSPDAGDVRFSQSEPGASKPCRSYTLKGKGTIVLLLPLNQIVD